ncbi:T9SS type A sorting domain-containing protein, partial [candidate division KSB1 bacterium]|nr:T9SS type A sorting domain-containing protein [candidate division KSB1 bacterium]
DSDWTIIDPNEALKRQKIKDRHHFEYIHFLADLEKDYLCKIKEIDFTDQSRFTSTVMVGADENPAQVIEVVSLEQNYPNPFNPVTTISFSVLEEMHLKISIYDILGRQIRTLKEERFGAGDFKLRWDGTDDYGNRVPSGEYFIMLRTGDNVKVVKKMIVRK